MTRRQFTVALSLLPVAARGAETPQERGRRIINQTIQALGGDSFRQMPGRLEVGHAYSFYSDQITGLSPAKIYTKYLPAAPGVQLREAQRQVFGKKEDNAVILTANEGWDITYRGARPLTDQRIAQFRDNALVDTFYILRMRVDEPNTAFVSRGSDVVENQPVEVIDFYDPDNRSVTMWIHSGTMLPVRQLVKPWDPLIQDRREEITRYTKYHDAGNGIVWPLDVQRERDGEKTFQLFSDSVQVGVYDDSMFKLPPGINLLKKAKI